MPTLAAETLEHLAFATMSALGSADEEARIVAHTIKGGSWNLEALRLGDAAALLEETTRNADTEGSWREHAKVAEEFEKLRSRLSEIEELKV